MTRDEIKQEIIIQQDILSAYRKLTDEQFNALLQAAGFSFSVLVAGFFYLIFQYGPDAHAVAAYFGD